MRWILALALAILSHHECCCLADDRGREICDKIIKSELSYRRLRASYVVTPIINGQPDGSKAAIVSGVWDDQRYLSEKTVSLSFEGKLETRKQSQSFDGSSTYLNHFDQVGNVWDDRIKEQDARPYYAGLSAFSIHYCLQDLFFFDAGRVARLSNFRGAQSITWEYLGEEVVGDDRLHVFRFHVTGIGEEKSAVLIEIKFSEFRNFLPAASTTSFSEPTSVISISSTVDSWVEIAPGVYLPENAHWITRFPPTTKEDSVQHYSLKEAVLDRSDLPAGVFSRVEMPVGAPVYTVTNGIITSTEIDGKGVGVPEEERSRGNWGNAIAFGVVFIGVNALVAGYFAFRRRGRFVHVDV